MEARPLRTALVISLLTLATVFPQTARAAGNFRTENFVVTAPSADMARQVAEQAERYRRELAIEWLGAELPRWTQPCPIQVEVGPQLGAGGVTSFSFDQGEVFGWQMEIKGPADRLLDSVLPHEITHTIFATHFRRPVPRWADEGACSTIEHESERGRLDQHLINYLHTDRGIAFSRMFAMKEYPRDILPLYAQGYSLARFLIGQGGRRKFIAYLGAGMQTQDWIAATREHYGFRDLRHLQETWLEWVRVGCPPVEQALAANAANAAEQPAGATEAQPPAAAVRTAAATMPAGMRGPIVRGQSPDAAPADALPAEVVSAAASPAAQPTPAKPRSRYFVSHEPPTDTAAPSEAPESATAEVASEAGWTPIRSRNPSASTVASSPASEGRPAGLPRDKELRPIASRSSAAAVGPERRGSSTVLLEWARPGVDPKHADEEAAEQVELAPTDDVLPEELAGSAERPTTVIPPPSAAENRAAGMPRWNRPGAPEMSDLPRAGSLRR